MSRTATCRSAARAAGDGGDRPLRRRPSGPSAWAAAFADRFEADLHIVQVILPRSPTDTRVRRRRGDARARRGRRARRPTRTQIAGERGRAHVVIDDDPAMAIVQRDRGARRSTSWSSGNAGMAGRKEFLLGNVPNRISHNARCTVIIVNTRADGQAAASRRRAEPRRRSATSAAEAETRAAPDGARHADRDRLRQARAEGAVRPAGRGGRRSAASGRPSGCAPRSRSWGRRSRSSDRSSRRGPTCCRPSSSRSSRRCRTTCRRSPRSRSSRVMEQELGVPWEDVFESHRAAAARGRHDRPGAPRDARERRAGRREGAAPRREGADRAGPGAAGAVRREGRATGPGSSR